MITGGLGNKRECAHYVIACKRPDQALPGYIVLPPHNGCGLEHHTKRSWIPETSYADLPHAVRLDPAALPPDAIQVLVEAGHQRAHAFCDAIRCMPFFALRNSRDLDVINRLEIVPTCS